MTGPPPTPSWPGQIPWPYSRSEKIADAVIHGLGIAFALSGALVLLVAGPGTGIVDRVAIGTYLATLSCVIVISAAYNTWPPNRIKWLLRRFDHAAIFLLIAGTYTPFLVRLDAPALLAWVWLFAASGVTLKFCLPGRYDGLSIGLYLLLGFSGCVLPHQLLETFSPTTLWLIGIGGFFYTSGIVFHLWERLPYQNAIWHGFVLTAASTHYAAVWSAFAAQA